MKRKPQSFAARRRQMARLRALGVTDRAIGLKFEVTGERVAQILGRKSKNGRTGAVE